MDQNRVWGYIHVDWQPLPTTILANERFMFYNTFYSRAGIFRHEKKTENVYWKCSEATSLDLCSFQIPCESSTSQIKFCWFSLLKVQCHEIFDLFFFHQAIPHCLTKIFSHMKSPIFEQFLLDNPLKSINVCSGGVVGRFTYIFQVFEIYSLKGCQGRTNLLSIVQCQWHRMQIKNFE
jgi:hypothetical protein